MRWRMIWLELVPVFKNIMNSIDERIQYEFLLSIENSRNSNPFLDVRITIRDSITNTDIYAKETDTFNYLPFNSCHPRHVIRNIPFVLARRIRGIVSDPSLLPLRMEEID